MTYKKYIIIREFDILVPLKFRSSNFMTENQLMSRESSTNFISLSLDPMIPWDLNVKSLKTHHIMGSRYR